MNREKRATEVGSARPVCFVRIVRHGSLVTYLVDIETRLNPVAEKLECT